MRLFFVIIFSFACLSLQAQSPYAAQWAEIDSLIDSVDQPRLAQERLLALERRADRDGNDPEYLKAFLKRLELEPKLNQQADSTIVARLQKTLATTKAPARKAILHLALAQVWVSWSRENRYRLLNRSELDTSNTDETDVPEDFHQWDLNTFRNRLLEQFELALENEQALSRISARSYVALLDTVAGSDRFRPTLYDLVAHTTFFFFTSDDFGPTAEELLTDFPPARLLSERRTFLQTNFGNGKERWPRYLKLIQQFLRFRDKQGDPYPLVHADLRRLDLLRKVYAEKQIETVYQQALATLAEEYNGHPVQAEIGAAQVFHLWTSSADLRQQDNRTIYDQQLVEAHARAQEIVKTYPDTRGAQTCQQTIDAIEEAAFSFQTETYIIPNRPYRARLSFRNLKKIYFRAIRLTASAKKQWADARYGDTEKARNFLRRQPYRRAWSQELPEVADYYPRSTEIAMPPLDPGEYIILASEDARFSPKARIFTYTELQATRMLFEMVHDRQDKQVRVLVKDRKKGSPYVRQRVELFRNPGSGDKRPARPDSVLYTDKQGAVYIPGLPAKRYWNFELRTRRGSDQIRFSGSASSNSVEANQVLAHIFTDRAIYRPGQPIYAKVLLYQRQGDQYQVLANQAVDIEFRDANGQVVEKRPLRTNGYGSAHTSFVAPDDRLLGRMTLRAMNQRKAFRVEEYKRPTFKVEMMVDSAQLGDSVHVSGLVKSYAGVPIAETDVKLSFDAIEDIPYWFRRYYPGNQSLPDYHKELTVKTNSKGQFKATVEAPARPVQKGRPSDYALDVVATVTDIAGETRTGQTSTNLSNLAYEAELILPKEVDKSLGGQLKINLLTPSGKGVQRNIEVEIAPVEYPLQPLRPRQWAHSNSPSLDKKAYKKLFPYDAYEEKEISANWPAGVALVKTAVAVDST
ncbi:MAG: MG2 domain-containing protein, partial [Bacteroidota bacterium]